MRFCCSFLFCAAAFAQVPALKTTPHTTDDRISVYEQWVAADPASTANQTLLAGAYIQKTRETTDFRYLDRGSRSSRESSGYKRRRARFDSLYWPDPRPPTVHTPRFGRRWCVAWS